MDLVPVINTTPSQIVRTTGPLVPNSGRRSYLSFCHWRTGGLQRVMVTRALDHLRTAIAAAESRAMRA